jgi:ribosome maturation factor RimP
MFAARLTPCPFKTNSKCATTRTVRWFVFSKSAAYSCECELVCRSVRIAEAHQWAKAHFLVGARIDLATQAQAAENMAFDLEKVQNIADRVARSSGLEVVDVEVSGGGKHRTLRVFIDRPGAAPAADRPDGVTHEDCAKFSREFGTIVDVEDAFPGGSYVLEVSSPGLDRKLTKAADFERFRGQRVKLMTREPVDNNRHFEGKLESFENGKLLLDLSAARKKKMRPKEGESSRVEIELRNVEKANLVPEI